MKLLEHEAKSIFSKYEIPVPRGELATSPSEARKIALGEGTGAVDVPRLGDVF